MMWSQRLPKTTRYVYVCLFVLTGRQRDERNPLERVAQQQRQERGEGEGEDVVDGGDQEEANSQREVETDDGEETQVWLAVCINVCWGGGGGMERERERGTRLPYIYLIAVVLPHQVCVA